MEIIILPDPHQAALLVARIIAKELRGKPSLVLGLATGRTMERVYACLVALHREQGLDFSRCSTFNLDEYIGIPAEHPASYRSYMEAHLFSRVNPALRVSATTTSVPSSRTSTCRPASVRVSTMLRSRKRPPGSRCQGMPAG